MNLFIKGRPHGYWEYRVSRVVGGGGYYRKGVYDNGIEKGLWISESFTNPSKSEKIFYL